MYTYTCTVLRVIDGDTLDLEIDLGFNVKIKERIRLYGVNTPEVFGSNSTEAGKRASDFTRAWVEKYSNMSGYFKYDSIKYDFKDKYGRGLGTITFVNTETKEVSVLTEELIRSGNTI